MWITFHLRNHETEMSTERNDQVVPKETTPRTGWSTIYGIALLWFGDPNARFAKFFAVGGFALVAAPWWQPVLQQLAVKHLGIPDTFLANADGAMFWSGWVLIAIALGLYVWVKRLQHGKEAATEDLHLERLNAPSSRAEQDLGSHENPVVHPGDDESSGFETSFNSWVESVVNQFLEEFNRLSTNTRLMICRALAIERSESENDVRVGVTQFFRRHSDSTTQDSEAVSFALDQIDGVIVRTGPEIQGVLMNLQDWVMTALVGPKDNPDIAVIRDNCDGVLFVGHPAGAELLFSVADHRKPAFILTDDGEVVGKHLLNLSNPPIGEQEPLILVRHFLTELADRIQAITFNNQVVDPHDHDQCIQFWAEQLGLGFKARRLRTGSRFYCCCPLPADSGSRARVTALLCAVSDKIKDLGVFRLDANPGTLSAEKIVVPLVRKRFERLL